MLPIVCEVVQGAVAAAVYLSERGRTRKADHIPANSIAIAAIDRVGVEALPGMQGQQWHETKINFRAGLLQRRFDRRAVQRRFRLRELGLLLLIGQLEVAQHTVLLV